MPYPLNKEDLLRILGTLTYLRKFIPNMSALTDPLRGLLKKSAAWCWDKNLKQQFVKIKQTLTNSPVLRYYSVTDPIVVSCDSSSRGLGAVLLQHDQPVAYAPKPSHKPRKITQR